MKYVLILVCALFCVSKEILAKAVAPRIAFGKYARHEHFPHVARLTVLMTHNLYSFCSGSLISANYVLTAAHCVNNYRDGEKLKVKGVLIVLGPENGQDNVIMYTNNITSHPNYVNDSKQHSNDIALLRFPVPVDFTKYIKPITLVSGQSNISEFYGKKANISGFGGTWLWAKSTNNLHYGTAKILSSSFCNYFKRPEDPEVICSYGFRHGCVGDSGGPLDLDGVQIGVTAHVLNLWRICGLPAIVFYTPVSEYRKWIAAHSDVKYF